MYGISNGRLIADLAAAADGDTEIRESWSSILEIRTLYSRRMVSAWDLKKSNTSLNSIDYEISAKLILLKEEKQRISSKYYESEGKVGGLMKWFCTDQD